MITIKKADVSKVEVLALLGRITYVESHGHFINDKNDLSKYVNQSFSIARTEKDFLDANNHFYIIYHNNLPIGYAKLVLNTSFDNMASVYSCKLDRIYILNDFIHMKLGKQLLTFVESKVRELSIEKIWLSVYIKNERAIRFYKKNNFEIIGELNFLVSQTEYKNIVFSKKL